MTALAPNAVLSLTDGFPRVDSPFFDPTDPALGVFADLASSYHENGFVVIPDVLDAVDAATIVGQVAGLYQPDLADGPRSSYRVQDAWEEAPAVRALAGTARILETLEALYGRRPFPFQTLNFRTGSQQRNHSDSIHFSSLPRRFMCGVWVALEDTDEANGPLFYVPGSHRLPELTLADMGMSVENASYARYEDVITEVVEAAGLTFEEVHIKKGSAFIWSANLIHGGMPILQDGRTRHSQVTHYFFDDCIHYTPFFSEMPIGELFVRTPTDIATGRAIAPRFNGQPVRLEQARANRVRLRFETHTDLAVDRIAAARRGFGAASPDVSAALDALFGILQRRADLQAAFVSATGVDVPALCTWAATSGLGVDEAAPLLRVHEPAVRALASPNAPAVSAEGRRRASRRRRG